MGQMIDGQWVTDEGIRAQKSGEFKRKLSLLRDMVSTDAGAKFPAESGRYHLYIAWNCPWAHRTVLMRALKGLQNHVSLSVAAPRRNDQGWVFDADRGYKDDLFGSKALHEVYAKGATGYTGRVTVPVLFDIKTNQIVNNESEDIVRILNSGFGDLANKTDFYPEALQPQIDA
ncbi:MAG: hypothetical protein AAGL17_10170, partial [Cyanobacteria bacterium J06576_12]